MFLVEMRHFKPPTDDCSVMRAISVTTLVNIMDGSSNCGLYWATSNKSVIDCFPIKTCLNLFSPDQALCDESNV